MRKYELTPAGKSEAKYLAQNTDFILTLFNIDDYFLRILWGGCDVLLFSV